MLSTQHVKYNTKMLMQSIKNNLQLTVDGILVLHFAQSWTTWWLFCDDTVIHFKPVVYSYKVTDRYNSLEQLEI